MEWLLVSLLLGILIGNMRFVTDKIVDRVRKVSTVGLILLLFSMGAQLGMRPEIIANLDTLGLKAVLISSFSIIFSTAALFLLDRFVISRRLAAKGESGLSGSRPEKPGLYERRNTAEGKEDVAK